MSQAEALYNLQQIDLDILQRRRRLNEIAEILGDNEAIKQAQAQVEAAKQALSPLRARLRDLELESQTTSDKAKSAEDRLYSGTVKNPKEMQDLQNEIDSLKKRGDALETDSLEAMMALEEAEGNLAEHEASLVAITEEMAGEHADLIAEQKQLNEDVERLKADRLKALEPVDEESFKLYKSMRKRKANKPIARLEGKSCSVCGIEQNVAIVQEVRKREGLVECINCRRILAAIL